MLGIDIVPMPDDMCDAQTGKGSQARRISLGFLLLRDIVCFEGKMRNVRLLFCLSLLILSLAATSTPAQQQGARVALVIGNAKYPNAATPLPNATKDATALAEQFRRLRFSVDVKTNLGKKEMQRAIDAFTDKIKKGTTALFYFSGFGLQVGRQSYLVPVNAQIWSEADVRRDGVSVDALLAEMNRKGARVKIIIIDAARRNPFERRFRSVAAGLAPLNAPVGTLVLYSGALNKLIDERSSGDHSMFAAELLKELHATDLTVETVFNRARIGVSRVSNGGQVPWVASSLLGDFYFGAKPAGAPATAARDTSPAPAADVDSKIPMAALEEPTAKPAPPPPQMQERASSEAQPHKPARMTVTVKLGKLMEKRGLLGVRVAGLNDELARTFGLKSAHGAFVTSVVPNGPAAQAGIAPTDVVVDFDGRNISSWTDLPIVVGGTPPGSSAHATLWRVAGNARELADRLQRRAESGDDSAAYGLAWLYVSEHGVLRDDALAAHWARQAAENGHAGATYMLGFLYSKGHGVAKDEAQAVSLFRKAAEKNDSNAMFALAGMYEKGNGIGKEIAEARRWYQSAAAAGHAPAMVALAKIYTRGEGVATDYVAAFNWFRKAADKNNPAGIANVGWMYESGRGVPQDYAQALRWYHKAADLHVSGAIYRLGAMAAAGHGVTKDDAEAVSWYRKAVDLDNPAAMVELGLMYENGRGVARDPVEGLRLFKKAGEKGNAMGLFYVGLSYERSKEFEKAVSNYTSSARLGNAGAMHNLAIAYDKGHGVKENPRVAAEWMFKAIKAGSEFSTKQMTDNPAAYSIQMRRQLQRLLSEAGVYDGPINGRATASFKAAVNTLAKRARAGR
jgi:TPR repeat protein